MSRENVQITHIASVGENTFLELELKKGFCEKG